MFIHENTSENIACENYGHFELTTSEVIAKFIFYYNI